LQEANNGTIYLNKIDALRPELQVRLLRFMQQGGLTFNSNKVPSRYNVRIIASTTKDLLELIRQKKFREDLYYRINTFSIKIPSLKEMGEKDISLLIENFYRNFAVHENKKIKNISAEAIYLLQNYEWEDNIRQLKNSIFRAVVLCDGEIIKPEHFPNLVYKENNNIIKAKASIKKNSDMSSELVDIFDDDGGCKSLDFLEEEIIKRLVNIYNGNLSEVAKQLNIGRSTIYRKLKISENA
jgi:DNA-binding NtrC family response regulator